MEAKAALLCLLREMQSSGFHPDGPEPLIRLEYLHGLSRVFFPILGQQYCAACKTAVEYLHEYMWTKEAFYALVRMLEKIEE